MKIFVIQIFNWKINILNRPKRQHQGFGATSLSLYKSRHTQSHTLALSLSLSISSTGIWRVRWSPNRSSWITALRSRGIPQSPISGSIIAPSVSESLRRQSPLPSFARQAPDPELGAGVLPFIPFLSAPAYARTLTFPCSVYACVFSKLRFMVGQI